MVIAFGIIVNCLALIKISNRRDIAVPLKNFCIYMKAPIFPIQALPDGSIKLKMLVKPGAKQSEITEINDSYIGLRVAAPPRDGEANEEVVAWLAKKMNIRQRLLTIISGHKCREKTILISSEGKLTVEGALKLLQPSV